MRILDAKLSYKGERQKVEFKEEVEDIDLYREELLSKNIHMVDIDEYSEEKPMIYFTYEEK